MSQYLRIIYRHIVYNLPKVLTSSLADKPIPIANLCRSVSQIWYRGGCSFSLILRGNSKSNVGHLHFTTQPTSKTVTSAPPLCGIDGVAWVSSDTYTYKSTSK